MFKFCPDLKCEFYYDFPEGSKFKFKLCPYCEAPLIDVRPNSVKEITDETTEEYNYHHKFTLRYNTTYRSLPNLTKIAYSHSSIIFVLIISLNLSLEYLNNVKVLS